MHFVYFSQVKLAFNQDVLIWFGWLDLMAYQPLKVI